MGVVEQAEEIEMLQSIYPDLITVVSANEVTMSMSCDAGEHKKKEYKGRSCLERTAPSGSEIAAAFDGFPSPSDKLAVATLVVRFGEDYPDTAPEVELHGVEGLEEEDVAALMALTKEQVRVHCVVPWSVQPLSLTCIPVITLLYNHHG